MTAYCWLLLSNVYVVAHPSVCLSVVCNVRAPYSGDWNTMFLHQMV